MKNKEFKKGIAIGVAATLVVTGAVFTSYQKVLFPNGNALSDVKTVQKLNYLEELIDEEYLDEKDESSLREGLYAGMLAGLRDPYSTYYTAEQYKELNTSNEGSYVGIGAVLQKDDTGGAKIIQLYEGGPGEQAGLKKGDVIKAVDGADVTDKETSDIASMVRDSEKASVMLTIQRENEEKTRDVKVEIRDVEIQTVSHEMLSGDTGYIRISEFSEVTSDQYKKAFADLKDQGMKKLVVDLRDNPGGLLTAVCGVLRQILPEGLIVYTEDKNGLALAFFCVSALLFSQGATSALLVPVAASLGCDAPMILACFVAVSGIFVTNVYPTSAFAISCDDTGSYMGKWSGSMVVNHPFFIPGLVGLVAAVPFGFMMAGIVL